MAESSAHVRPYMWFLFVGPKLCPLEDLSTSAIRLPSDSTSRWTPLPSANGSCYRVRSGLSPPSCRPCRAHQTLPRDGDFTGLAGAFRYDHIFDHNDRRSTRIQCERHRRRPGRKEQRPANELLPHVTPGSNAFGTKRPWVQVPQPGPLRVSVTDLRTPVLLSSPL